MLYKKHLSIHLKVLNVCVCMCTASMTKFTRPQKKRYTFQFNFKMHKIQKRSFGILVAIVGLVGINF